ncbi:alkaline phosphatase family protein [Sporomusa ovata]|uniref:Alkaline phosphatase family protein n=1 Tax=Sporomusa ovata TaxID=2378 RepID=A0A0U1L297_9FIRM|nr:nucleotide pyrophosphatase/phosphodiesterase family protein [Sporomusa ovata]CQR73781.1 FIG01125970: hypothetical protein [Sporomusa ovata]
MSNLERLVVFNVVGLTPAHIADKSLTLNINRMAEAGAVSVVKPQFPAVTGSIQATYLTGCEPCRHGIIGNGVYDRQRSTVTMWEQTGARLEGKTIWQTLKNYDPKSTTAILFWQFIKYASADIVLTPSPIHNEKGITTWCFSSPSNWYETMVGKIGEFPLHHFWGPLASIKSSEWIMKATLETIKTYDPNLTLVYLPNLDYNAQRFGPNSEEARQSVKEIDTLIGQFIDEIVEGRIKTDTNVLILSEYAIQKVSRAVHINKVLRDKGFLQVALIDGKEYIDFFHSQAFAVADHQLAHVYCKENCIKEVKITLRQVAGISEVLGEVGKKAYRIDHENSGELVAIAEKDAWFTYYWWKSDEQAPGFVRGVDIHRKPGYDPCELFIDPVTRSIPLKPKLIMGSHGRPAEGSQDLVSLVAYGPQANIIGKQGIWETRDIHSLLLEILGYPK